MDPSRSVRTFSRSFERVSQTRGCVSSPRLESRDELAFAGKNDRGSVYRAEMVGRGINLIPRSATSDTLRALTAEININGTDRFDAIYQFVC